MKRFIGFVMVILSLQAIGAEQMKFLCASAKGEVSIAIEEDCLSVIVKKNIITWGPRYDCPRGPCSNPTNSHYIDHSFSTCKINTFGEYMEQQESTYRSGKWISYKASAEKCMHPGCIGYKAYILLADSNYDGSWRLASLSTSKVGSDYYEVNEHYNLPQELKGLSCKKL